MDDKADKIEHIMFFVIPNIIGIIVYLPLLFALLMSLGAPGGGENWIHWFWVSLNILLGPLCLIGLIFKKYRHLGWVGFGLVFMGFFILGALG
ncbi:hypothetical protein [Sedimenticola selenatireducens]|uniref:hypothetical protein n=1 Tax=Sedimenticola selenatireducens TaxID=191960 RepID=UPI002AAA88BB|nr:hypothetical protein [Sedimenticola selenatireducens]